MRLTATLRAQKLIESMDEFGDTPIIKACRRGHAEVASFLLEQVRVCVCARAWHFALSHSFSLTN